MGESVSWWDICFYAGSPQGWGRGTCAAPGFPTELYLLRFAVTSVPLTYTSGLGQLKVSRPKTLALILVLLDLNKFPHLETVWMGLGDV